MVKVEELASVIKGYNRDGNVYIKVGDTVYPINTVYEAPDGTYIKLIADTSQSRNDSPRNLSRKVCISLKTLYESGHENLKNGGYIRHTEEEGSEYYDLCADTGAIIDTVLLSDGEEVSVLKETDENVYVEVSETIEESTEAHYHVMFSLEEFSIATFR